MVVSFSEKNYLDDLIKYIEDEQYSIPEVTVYNRTGSTISAADVFGHPLRPDSSVAGAYRFCLGTEESYCTALLLETKSFALNTLANNASFKTKALVRGMATIDKAIIPTADVAATAFTLSTLVTALQALNPPILCHAEQTPTATQTR